MTEPKRLKLALRPDSIIIFDWKGVQVMLEVEKISPSRARILIVAPEEVKITKENVYATLTRPDTTGSPYPL